jgi:hypothetical protein
MPNANPQKWESAKLEYEHAINQYLHCSSLRRQDMVFVTTVQAAVLTIIGVKLQNLDLAGLLLSIIAFFVLLLGVNSERRISAYMSGYMRRANQIESEHSMSLLSNGRQEIKRKKFLVSNAIVFPLYYFVFIIAWIVIWIVNLQ